MDLSELVVIEVVAGECISNDPVVGGEAQYKPWSGPFGSARPIRGIHYRSVRARGTSSDADIKTQTDLLSFYKQKCNLHL